MLRRSFGSALIAAAIAHSAPGRAQDAQALFDEGLSDMMAGRYKLGCALIKQSLDVDARPGTIFTLAECYARAGRSASAMEMYDRFLAVYDGMPEDVKAQQAARAELSRSERTRLVSQVSWLTVQLPDTAPAGVVVTRDGEPFNPGLFGVAMAVDPGAHVFTARAPDGPLTEQRVDIAPGERKGMLLTVQMPGGVTPLPPELGPVQETEPRAVARPISPWVWVAGGIGAAGLITFGVTGGMLLHERSIIKKECPNRSDNRDADGRIICSPEGLDAVNLAQDTLAPATTIALGVGAAGVVVATVLLVTRGHEKAPALALPTVEVMRGGAALGLSSRW